MTDWKKCVPMGPAAYLISDIWSRGVFFDFTEMGLAKIQPTDLFRLEGNEILPFVEFKAFFFFFFVSVM